MPFLRPPLRCGFGAVCHGCLHGEGKGTASRRGGTSVWVVRNLSGQDEKRGSTRVGTCTVCGLSFRDGDAGLVEERFLGGNAGRVDKRQNTGLLIYINGVELVH
jgi:hypothetical protein